jgi:hypothetical protein
METIQTESRKVTSYQRLIAEEQRLIDTGANRSSLAESLAALDEDYNLPQEVECWSDFLRLELAPKSIFELSGVSFSPEAFESQMGSFSQGRSLLEDVYEVSLTRGERGIHVDL